MKPWIVRITPVQIAHSDAVAHARFRRAREVGRIPANNAPIDVRLDIKGMRCEQAAAAAFVGIYWHDYVTKDVRNLPDLSDFIDVKGIDHPHHRLIVQQEHNGGKKHWAYLLVDGSHHPDYEICGWVWGRSAMRDDFEDCPVAGREPAFYLPKAVLSDPRSLYELALQKK